MKGIQILMYHQVGDFPEMASHRATYCDHRRFATQMAWLKLGGYQVLRMEEALKCLRGDAPMPPRGVVLTFDDAYENFYEYAFPILQKHGFPATVYAISSLLGQSASWLAADGHATPPLMSAARLRQLHSAGIEIGSHSASHVRLAEQGTEHIREEVTRSKKELEDALGARVDHFCYPYGSHDIRAVEAVAEAGYQSGTTCERAWATPEDDPLTLPRKAVSWGDSLVGVWWKMHFKNISKRPPVRRQTA
ncbi:polysaccharide deacetylase family protein [Noviherbaspirillum massiliense]|uniref:polysaccharide deacetylase family protein n=1 Tax=Noviherbaspirillum massiliense TaxID=1465823 RepID=UPI0002F776F6|nr:polysaccharide deacetylase family protein [Noviherbaspirillum massiliense]